MSTEANKAIVCRVIDEVPNQGNLAVIDELFAANVVYDVYEFECPGTVSFAVADGAFSGTGQCQIEIDTTYDVPFTLEGTVGDGAIAGVMTLNADGTDYETPFAGTGRSGSTFSASYDTTHRTSDGDLRIYGTWTADPQ